MAEAEGAGSDPMIHCPQHAIVITPPQLDAMENHKICEQIKNSQFTRIIVVAFLIIILQIPTLMLQGLVGERQSLRQEAITSITSKWGSQQILIGPQLVVPYQKRDASGQLESAAVKWGVFLPDELQITGQLDGETRYRGIFEVPVYRTTLNIQGRFVRPDLTRWGVKSEDILWDQAELILQISDAQAIQTQTPLNWNNKPVAFAPGLGKFGGSEVGIHASLKGQITGESFDFAIPLELNGSEKLNFAPLGKVTQVELTSDWTNPSFQGFWLPTQREVTAQGFAAKWNIPSLGRNFAQQWNSDAPVSKETVRSSVFGVDLISPVDNYRMAERSIKYNFLFLLLTFAALWLFEVIVRLRVHPLQYLLVGVAMSIFYLLQLALSEHMGFQ